MIQDDASMVCTTIKTIRIGRWLAWLGADRLGADSGFYFFC